MSTQPQPLQGPYTARRTSTAPAAGWEVVDASGARAAYVPPPPRSRDPATSQALARDVLRRSGIMASALTADAGSAAELAVRDDSGRVTVWDGSVVLLEVVYSSQDDRSRALMRASAFVDGFLLARRLCLGARDD